MTLRILTHELRTPISHIIGYSEMLLEDLADGADSAGVHTLQVVHATGKELLALVNAQLESRAPDAVVTPEVLANVRSAVQRSIDRIPIEDLEASSLAQSRASAEDMLRILQAATRLAEFARAGTVRISE